MLLSMFFLVSHFVLTLYDTSIWSLGVFLVFCVDVVVVERQNTQERQFFCNFNFNFYFYDLKLGILTNLNLAVPTVCLVSLCDSSKCPNDGRFVGG